jgi:toxin YoeB
MATRDKKIHDRIIVLINEIIRDPFKGIGKPEPLKYDLKGWWSRRITDEHRLIYKVTDTEIVILSCYSHYEN